MCSEHAKCLTARQPGRNYRKACALVNGQAERHYRPAGRIQRIGEQHMKGFKNFLMRGDVIVVAVGLVVALAFSALITAFTTDIIKPLVNAFESGKNGLGTDVRSGNPATFVNVGDL